MGGTTQIGEVKRPLAAVSKITAKKKLVCFHEEENCIIDPDDPVYEQIVKLMKAAVKKTKMHLHKGTYHIRAWVLPPKGKEGSGPFARPGKP